MAEIVLSTLNARYAHSSLALRYLHANLGDLGARAVIREFVIQERPSDVVEVLLAEQPRVVALGIYIWNAAPALEVVRVLRQVAPEVVVVLGGPEVSHDSEAQEICALADYVVAGEGEVAFRDLCTRLLAGERPAGKLLPGGLPELARLASPYPLYSDRDVAERVIYVEASRGCPFSCEFCLSSLDIKVRAFPRDAFFADMEALYARGVRHFRFIDRTFNLKIETSVAILQFFLARAAPDLFVHFEVVPDRLPPALREVIRAFPPACLQFEVGIQTFDDATATRIGRRQNVSLVEENLRFLRDQTGVHVHADLIAGLPGEGVESFAAGFDRLVALAPQEIQVGILKKLRGTPIGRHDAEWQMVWSESPPYELLANRLLSFALMQRLKRFARAWDLCGNSGNFAESLPLLWENGQSPFHTFMAFTDWLGEQVGAFTGIALPRLARLLFDYLAARGRDQTELAAMMARDFVRPGRTLPEFLAERVATPPPRGRLAAGIPTRQARHLAAARPR